MIKPPHLGGLYEYKESDVNVIISDSKLRELLTPQVKILSKQRRCLCGFEICIL